MTAVNTRSHSKDSARLMRRASLRLVEQLERRVFLSAYVVTTLADSGVGSLRDAISQANAHPGGDTVTFAAGLKGIIKLTSGQLEFSDTSGQTTLQGPGVAILTVSGNGASRVFQVDAAVVASISGLSITHGKASALPGVTYAGGGGLLCYGTVRLVNDNIASNTATAAAGMLGGGILFAAVSANQASSIANCALTGNSATMGGGAIDVISGILTLSGDVFISNSVTTGGNGGAIGLGGGAFDTVIANRCVFARNSVDNRANLVLANGGAIGGSQGSAVTITQSSFYKNIADGSGGAIFNVGSLYLSSSDAFIDNHSTEGGGAVRVDGGAVISDATFSGNSTEVEGGALYSLGTINLSNSTFANNRGGGSGGGALFLSNTTTITGCTFTGNVLANSIGSFGGAIDSLSNLTIINSTFTANMANDGGAIGNLGHLVLSDSTLTANVATRNGNVTTGGGIFTASTAGAVINNSIIAGNFYVQSPGPNHAGDISGAVSGGANLIGTGGSGGLINGVNGNIVGATNLGLTSLGSHGGPTQTIGLLAGSPAAGVGSINLIPAEVTADQRGLPRVVNGKVDIGAFQNQVGNLTGSVFNDANGNGIRDAGETGIAGARVFLDYGGNGVWNPATEPSVLTNSSGVFTFTNIAAVTYSVGTVVPAGMVKTAPTGDLVATVIARKTVNAGSFGEH